MKDKNRINLLIELIHKDCILLYYKDLEKNRVLSTDEYH